jgi:DNA-binding MarR family transcriptional regulator
MNFHNCSDCPFGITFSQCHAMMEIEDLKNKTLQEISDLMNLDKSTVSKTIDNLHRRGYVLREIPPDNRRTVRLSLTAEGQNIASRVNRVNDTFFGLALQVLPEEELVQFIRNFSRVAEEMERLNAGFRNFNQ